MMCYPFCMEEMWRKRIVNKEMWRKRIVNKMKSVRNIRGILLRQ